jgi:hypothetical protein
MTRRRSLWIAAGILLLACAAGSAFLAQGTSNAARSFREQRAEWQRGLAPTPASSPGRGQRAGEAILGISARSGVLRAYRDYRAGLANVIPGTTYPQARARFEAIKNLEQLRGSLGSNGDRSAVDVVVGVILTDAASNAGPQRRNVQKSALAAFERAVRDDPANATAKLDLEVLLQATSPRTKSRPRPSRPGERKPRSNENPRNPTAPARAEGTGF